VSEMRLSVAAIRLDGGTQPRAQLSHETLDDYALAMKAGAVFPPVVVFYDGTDYWLADGFHRVRAALLEEIGDVLADVRQGTQRDAVLYSVGANSDHGVPRNNEDKRRAVRRLLEDSEWVQWSDHTIADRCRVSQPFVSKLREQTEREAGKGNNVITFCESETGNVPETKSVPVIPQSRKYRTSTGKTATMSVPPRNGGIQSRKKKETQPAATIGSQTGLRPGHFCPCCGGDITTYVEEVLRSI
jgi:hypothetical protein